MGLLADSLPTLRSGTTSLASPASWLLDAFGYTPTDAGISVSEQGSLKYSAVYACVSVLAQSIAQVPWDVYRRTDDGTKRTVARDRSEHWLLHSEPNGTMSSYSYRVAFMANCLLYGNMYSELIRDGANRVRAIRLLPSWTVQVFEDYDKDRLIYKVTRRNGTQDTLDGSDVVHMPCISLDGVAGLSPISQHRQAIGLGLAAEKMGAAFFGNGSRPSGFLYSKATLTQTQKDDIAERWKKNFQGSENTGKVPVLSGELDWKQLSINPDDAQFLETREFQISDIARIFRVPAVLIGQADKTATYASVEQFLLAFVKFSLTPWVQSIEQEFNRKLFPNTEDLYCKLDLNGLLRGDSKGRSEYYKSLFGSGAMSQNDIRALEEMDPIEGGDRYWVQQGYMPLDKADEILLKQGSGQVKQPSPDGQGQQPQTNSAHRAWLEDVISRVQKWEKKDSARIADAIAPVFRSLAGKDVDVSGYVAEIPLDGNFATRAIEKYLAEVKQ